MLMEIMGLHMPGASFVNPGTPLRDALTRSATHRVAEITARDRTTIRPWAGWWTKSARGQRHRRADGHGRLDQSTPST
jgi:hypothetical protein